MRTTIALSLMATWENAWLAKAAETRATDAEGRLTTSRHTRFLENTHRMLRLVAKNDAGEWIVHEGGALTVGRQPDQDLVITRKTVSGKHAAVLSVTDSDGVKFFVQDWSSKGSFVNGRPISKRRHVLKEGDVIHFGDRHFSTRLDIVEIRPVNSALPPSILQEDSKLIEPAQDTTTTVKGGDTVAEPAVEGKGLSNDRRRSQARERARGRLRKKPDKSGPDLENEDNEKDKAQGHVEDVVAAEIELRQRRTAPIYSRGTLGVRGSEAHQRPPSSPPTPILKSHSPSPSRARGTASPSSASSRSRYLAGNHAHACVGVRYNKESAGRGAITPAIPSNLNTVMGLTISRHTSASTTLFLGSPIGALSGGCHPCCFSSSPKSASQGMRFKPWARRPCSSCSAGNGSAGAEDSHGVRASGTGGRSRQPWLETRMLRHQPQARCSETSECFAGSWRR